MTAEVKKPEEGGLFSYDKLNKKVMFQLDDQDIETYTQLMNEPTKYVYFDKDDDKDFFITEQIGTNEDGSPKTQLTRIARCVNINGIQFRIPCQVKYPVPASVYERLMQSAEDARRLKPILEPNSYKKLGEHVDNQWSFS